MFSLSTALFPTQLYFSLILHTHSSTVHTYVFKVSLNKQQKRTQRNELVHYDTNPSTQIRYAEHSHSWNGVTGG